jgi:hypothetical protein
MGEYPLLAAFSLIGHEFRLGEKSRNPSKGRGVVERDSNKHPHLEEFIAMSSACIQPPIYIFTLEKSSRADFRGVSGNKIKTSACAANSQKDWTAPKASSQGAIDRWLNEKLQMLYGPVLSEPIPEQLVQLIAEHRRDEEEC